MAGTHSAISRQQNARNISEEDFTMTRFDLAKHMKEKAKLNEAVDNPFIPPSGCPINHLPPELLSYIFMIGMDMQMSGVGEESGDDDDDEDYIDSESDFSDSDTPDVPFQVLVSHVCRQWREVALQTPTLWTTIDFLKGPPYEQSRIWIERSKGAPLDITISSHPSDRDDAMSEDDEEDSLSDDDFPPPMTLEDLSTVLSIIIPHVERWKYFNLTVHDYKFMHKALLELSKCSAAPALEALEFYHYSDWDLGPEDDENHTIFRPQEYTSPFAPFQGNAPNLKSVALWGVHIAWQETNFISGLDDLELAYHTADVRPSYADFARMLRSSPNLKILTLSASGPAGVPADWCAEDGTIDTIELLSLTDLVLAFHTTAYACGLVNILSLPVLTNLTLDFDVEDGDQTAFVAQMVKPRPGQSKSLLHSIANLKIGGMVCDPLVMNDLLGALTNLRCLNLNVEHVDLVLFEKLAHPIAVNEASPRTTPLLSNSVAAPNTPMYCPLLDTITTSGVDGECMRTFLQTRQRAGVSIKRVYMNEDDHIDVLDEEWIVNNVDKFELFEGSDDEDVIEIDEVLDEDLDGLD